MEADVVDLNALVPQERRIRIGDPVQEIVIQPPKLGHILKLGVLGQKMQNAGEMQPEELDSLMSKMVEQLKEMVPELKDIDLTTTQTLKLFEIISEMATPEKFKTLQERGVTADTPKGQ